jgi:hypothetical protein
VPASVSACSLRRRAAIRAEGYVTNVFLSDFAFTNFAPQFAHSAGLRFAPPAATFDVGVAFVPPLAPFLLPEVGDGRFRARGRWAPPSPSRRPPHSWHHHSDMTPTDESDGMSSSSRTRAI